MGDQTVEEAIKTLRSFIIERCDPKHPTTRVVAAAIDTLVDHNTQLEAERDETKKVVEVMRGAALSHGTSPDTPSYLRCECDICITIIAYDAALSEQEEKDGS